MLCLLLIDPFLFDTEKWGVTVQSTDLVKGASLAVCAISNRCWLERGSSI